MADILLIGNNDDLDIDLQNQIKRFIPQTLFVSQNPDLIIISDEKESDAQWRQKYPVTPIIRLSTQKDNLNNNLNIYLQKPFKLAELIDIIQAANNKLNHSADGYIRFNQYELRPNLREIEDLTGGICVKLTEKEVSILQYLYKNADQYVTKTDLQKNVWQYNEDVTTHTIETHIYRLRQKVENNLRRLILTDNGSYKLNTGEK